MDETIVLLHGGYGRPEVWAGVCEHLDRRRFEFVTPTGPSWGGRRDEPVVAMSAAEMADDVARQVHVDARPIHLVGFSMGGVLALEFALQRRWPLASLTLIEASPTPMLRLTDHHVEAEEHAEGCYAFAAAVAEGEPDPAARVFEANNGPGYWKSLPEKARETLNRFAPAAARDAVMEADRVYRIDELGGVHVPTLIVHGSATVPRLRHISESLARFIPFAEIKVIDDADHDVLAAHPVEVAAAITLATNRRHIP